MREAGDDENYYDDAVINGLSLSSGARRKFILFDGNGFAEITDAARAIPSLRSKWTRNTTPACAAAVRTISDPVEYDTRGDEHGYR